MNYPLNHTKRHEENRSFRVISCDLVDISLSSFSLLRRTHVNLTLTALAVGARDYRTKALLVLTGCNESAYHCQIVVGHTIVQDVQPEIVAALVRVAAQVAEILHGDECRV